MSTSSAASFDSAQKPAIGVFVFGHAPRERARIRRVSKSIDRELSESLWRRARTFEELCALAARFVEGELAYFPGWLAPALDVESDAIAPHLARLCRAGFLTLASQPGRASYTAHDGTPGVQRAFVTGFVAPALARTLVDCTPAASIEIFVFGANAVAREIPVSLRSQVPYAFTGHDATADEIECFEDCVSPEALLALHHAHYVAAVDLTWGRNEVLWSELERIVVSAGA